MGKNQSRKSLCIREGQRENKGRMCSLKNGLPSEEDISENIMKALHCSLSIRLHISNNESSK